MIHLGALEFDSRVAARRNMHRAIPARKRLRDRRARKEASIMRSPSRPLLLLAFALFAAALGSRAPACAVDNVSFLLGVWRSEGQSHGEERWALTAANTLAGGAWVAEGTKLSFAEIMTIQPSDDAPEMHLRHFDGALNRAWEEKDMPMRFRLATCDGSSAVFEGLGEKTGERITYRRSGDQLDFVGDFLRQGKPWRVEVHMHRVAD
jgi:hypothetical protein